MKTKYGVKFSWVTVALLIAYWVFCASFYGKLSERLPTHWNLAGQVNGYSNKAVVAFIMPLLPLAIYIFMTIAPALDPKKQNYQKFNTSYEKIRIAIVLLLVVFSLLPLLIGLGYQVNVSLFARLALPLLFIVLGNYTSKIRYNYFTGIKVPWTLASEEVWNKTHRLGGKLMVMGGITSLLGVFAPHTTGVMILLAGIIVPRLLAIAYSYVLYVRLVK